MAKQPKPKAETKAPAIKDAPKEGFAGAPPVQSGWFATNYLCTKGGKLFQLHKRVTGPAGPDSVTDYWWFPVKAA